MTSYISKKTRDTISVGLAIFSMFFGAGNVVLPLSLGVLAGSGVFYAISGFTLTAVASPLLGLAAMVVFDGNMRAFFAGIGQVPGFILSGLAVALIGPLAGIPRCIALSHTTVSMFLPGISLGTFSLIAVLVLFLFSMRESRILDLLGNVLSPLLLLSLAIIVLRGLWSHPDALPSTQGALTLFMQGLYEGYQTMDLLAALFFSSVVLVMLRKKMHTRSKEAEKSLMRLTFHGGLLGAFLLAVAYVGFALVASYWANTIGSVTRDQTIGAIAQIMLGPIGGAVAAAAVLFATLTTAISLATVFSEFFEQEVTDGKVSYIWSLGLTLIVSFCIANQGFEWIIEYVWPLLKVCYPAIIVLAIMNLIYKLTGFHWIKMPFYLTLCYTVASLYGSYVFPACALLIVH